MAISKDELSMLNPTADGSNYGVPVNMGQKAHGVATTNYNECVASVTGISGIEKALGSVTSSGACGQDFTNKLVQDGGKKLGRPLSGGGGE